MLNSPAKYRETLEEAARILKQMALDHGYAPTVYDAVLADLIDAHAQAMGLPLRCWRGSNARRSA
jgi:hypothetical protein